LSRGKEKRRPRKALVLLQKSLLTKGQWSLYNDFVSKINMNSLPQTNNYTQLLQECKEIITEYEFTSRWALVEGYHQLGEKLQGLELVIMTRLAEDLGKSTKTLKRAKQFYHKYPDLALLPEGKNTSWYAIVNKYLPDTINERPPENITCPYCKRQFLKDATVAANGQRPTEATPKT